MFQPFLHLLWRLAGADPYLLGGASAREQRCFAWLGFYMLFLALFAAWTIDHTFVLMLKNANSNARFFGILLAAGAGFVYLFMYRFVFVVTPGEGEGWLGSERDWSYRVSVIIRFVCVAALGFLIAKAYELFIYEQTLQPILDHLRNKAQPERIEKLRFYLHLSPRSINFVSTGGILSRFVLLSAVVGWKTLFTTIPLTFLYLIPILIKNYVDLIQDGEHQHLKVQQQELIILNAAVQTEKELKRLWEEVHNGKK
jgi:hypothetical protein